jgi:soluble P-type ATPase
VFDKTGTLTERHAEVTTVLPAPGWSTGQVLALAAAVEVDSDHPIAGAVLAAASAAADGPSPLPEVGSATDVQARLGSGVAGLVAGHPVEVARLPDEPLAAPLGDGADECLRRGETVVVVRHDDEVVGILAVATPLRPEAADAVARLAAMDIDTVILSGDSAPAVETAAATLGVSGARSALTPAGKVEALEGLRDGDHQVMMVGDGVNDAPALAAANVGCAIGSGSEAALANSDVALLGNDLRGVPAVIGMADATYSIIIQNFAWAMGYNVSALPLAAFGLLDPLVAALAMGLSSVVVVLNSLRLARMGRSGLADVRAPKALRGGRGIAVSILLPVLLFAGLTVVSQVVSPARGESLLPTLPTLVITQLPDGGSVETYFDPGGPGVNQFHVIFSGTPAQEASTHPLVTASRDGGPPQVLRQITYGVGHYSDVVVLTPGRWVMTITSRFGDRHVTVHVTQHVS